jgi:hypothetical protein
MAVVSRLYVSRLARAHLNESGEMMMQRETKTTTKTNATTDALRGTTVTHSWFHVDNGVVMVEHTDREALLGICRRDSRFSGCKVKHVLRTYPSPVLSGVTYDMNEMNSGRLRPV